jgi:hypothetical protein
MKDRLQLLKYALIAVVLIAAWLGSMSLSHNILVQSLLGWIGLGVVVFYYRWLRRNRLRPPKSESGPGGPR